MTWSIFDEEHAIQGYGILHIRTNQQRTGGIYAILHRGAPNLEVARVEVPYDICIGNGCYALSRNAERAALKKWVEQNK